MAILTISTNENDCWGQLGAGTNFSSTSTELRIGKGVNYGLRSWIPFVVPLPKEQIIKTATLQVYASSAQTGDICNIKVGCEKADNPAAPGSYSDLQDRIMTDAYVTASALAHWVAGDLKTFDATTPVQEILNRTGWVSGNTLAVMLDNNGSDASAFRYMASYEHLIYTEPVLVIETVESGSNPVTITPYMMI
jgi:hypothetical protein